MTPIVYAKFQALQPALFGVVDALEPIETAKGNELFQRLSDAALEVYENHPNENDKSAPGFLPRRLSRCFFCLRCQYNSG